LIGQLVAMTFLVGLSVGFAVTELVHASNEEPAIENELPAAAVEEVTPKP
jgi:hypothetical protein